jgi:hypothetical protein
LLPKTNFFFLPGMTIFNLGRPFLTWDDHFQPGDDHF